MSRRECSKILKKTDVRSDGGMRSHPLGLDTIVSQY